MAYIDFAQPAPAFGSAISLPAVRDRIMATAQGFSPAEWQVVQLARTDGLSSLREPGRLDRLKTLFFGPQPHFKLADGKLEALRRLAVEAWHQGFAVRPSSIDAFLAAGFTEGQVETLLSAVTAARRAIKGR